MSLHPVEKHQILLTDLRLAAEALPVILRDHMRDDHGLADWKGVGLPTISDAHDATHAIDEYEEREGIRL